MTTNGFEAVELSQDKP